MEHRIIIFSSLTASLGIFANFIFATKLELHKYAVLLDRLTFDRLEICIKLNIILNGEFDH